MNNRFINYYVKQKDWWRNMDNRCIMDGEIMTNKRFTETLSTGIVTDNVTGKEYNCEMRIDDKLLELLNELHEENTR